MTAEPSGRCARIGMIVPSGNILAEGQVQAMLPADVGLHVTRLRLTGSSDADLDGMLRDLPLAAGLLADARVDLIAFNCTAVSTRSPQADAAIERLIADQTGIAAVTTAAALVAGLRALAARRIVLVTPYIEAVTAREAVFFTHHGFEVLSQAGAGIDSNWDMAQVPRRVWQDMTERQRHADADAYVLSCTAIDTAEIIEPLEASLGRPVLTSNQAVTWYAARRAGSRLSVPRYGGLFRLA